MICRDAQLCDMLITGWYIILAADDWQINRGTVTLSWMVFISSSSHVFNPLYSLQVVNVNWSVVSITTKFGKLPSLTNSLQDEGGD